MVRVNGKVIFILWGKNAVIVAFFFFSLNGKLLLKKYKGLNISFLFLRKVFKRIYSMEGIILSVFLC